MKHTRRAFAAEPMTVVDAMTSVQAGVSVTIGIDNFAMESTETSGAIATESAGLKLEKTGNSLGIAS